MTSDNEETGIASDNEEESLAKCLWNMYRDESFIALHHPFLIALASGTLEHSNYQTFITQEFHLLKCYTKTFDELLAESLYDDFSKMSIKLLIDELKKKYESLFKEESFHWVKAFPATVNYTDFLLKTASKKVAVNTLGALMPRLQLYAFIGTELQSVLDASSSSHPYKDWINYYASQDFQAFAIEAMAMLDNLSVPVADEDLDIIHNLYNQAMKFELDFFYSHPMMQRNFGPSVVPLLEEFNPSEHHFLVCSDFDLTCTVDDSSPILAEIAIERVPESDLRNRWGLLSREYTEEYEQCIESILNTEYEPMEDYEGEKHYEIVKKALEQLSEVEKMANTSVIGSGLLKGLNLEDIKRASERIIPQVGCISFFESITKNVNISASIHVISSCWCNDLINSVFSSGDLQDTLNIHANELIYDKSSISTGGLVRKVECPNDKVKCFDEILSECDGNINNYIVYIGDSVGDLLCLLDANIGIVIGSNESLRKVGSHFGISFVPLFHAFVQKQKEIVEGGPCCWKQLSGTLYTVSCWAEIHSLIVGLKQI